MANGSFDVQLVDGTPQAITDAADMATEGFATLIVTPTWVDPTVVTVDSLITRSVFSGMLTGRSDRTRLTGTHVTGWAGDPGGIGDINERLSNVLNVGFNQWMIWGVPTALTAGAISNFAAVTMSWDPIALGTRSWWDQVCAYFRSATGNGSIQWQVDDQLRVNAGTSFALYGSDLPVAMLTPDFDGWDPVLPGVSATLTVDDDVEDYAGRVLLYYNTGGIGATGSQPYREFDNATVTQRKRAITDNDVTAASATEVAAEYVGRNDQSRRKLTATTNRYCAMLDVPVGFQVACWDQQNGIVDRTQKYEWRGTIASPIITSVDAVTMPLEAGMGVYLFPGAADRLSTVDLTPWVEWESPGARIDLGGLDRSLIAQRPGPLRT